VATRSDERAECQFEEFGSNKFQELLLITERRLKMAGNAEKVERPEVEEVRYSFAKDVLQHRVFYASEAIGVALLNLKAIATSLLHN
jgi:hypothetical protein